MPQNQPIVVIDPGHGGDRNISGSSANNATGPNGLLEKNLTLDLSQRVAAALASDAQVILTRQDDRNLSLAARADVARRNQAAIFLSIHMNGFNNPQVDGTEVWVARQANTTSRALASAVLRRLLPITQVRDRGVRERDLGVLLPTRHAAATAACLVEVAFLTNPDQARRLENSAYLQQIADAIAAGIRDQLGLATPSANPQAFIRQAAYQGQRSTRSVRTLSDDSMFYGMPNGTIMDEYYRNAAERPRWHHLRDCHLGVDIHRKDGVNNEINDPRRGASVYAALLAEIDLAALNQAKPAERAPDGSCEGIVSLSNLNLPDSGVAKLQDAVVDVQHWKSRGEYDYGGVIGLACHYTYNQGDNERNFTLYLEFLHLITPSYLPRIPRDGGGLRTVSAEEWAATGKGSGFGPQMVQDALISAEDLTGGNLLVGYSGAITPPHVHIQAAFGNGRQGYILSPRFDPRVMLQKDLPVAGTSQALTSQNVDGAGDVNAELSPQERRQWLAMHAAMSLSSSASWADDNVSPDYRHLNAAGQSQPFTFTGSVLDALCQYNRFDVSAGQDEVLFGLRGCRLVDATSGFVSSITLDEDIPDHDDFHCVIGVWKRSTNQLAAFTGSTVPNWKYMKEQVSTQGHTANMLGTGCHLCTIGTHVGEHITLPGAFRQAENAVVLRSNDDLTYTVTDFWDHGMFGDNIHPAFLDQGNSHPRFSSAGCQTIPGSFADGQHTGMWNDFRQAAGLSPNSPKSENGRAFLYVLLTGREARLAATGSGAASLTRLRFGSRGPDVQALQLGLQNAGALSGGVDGVMAVGTVMDYINWQKAHDSGQADGIVTPQTAQALGFDLLAGQTLNQFSNVPGGASQSLSDDDIPLDPGNGGRSINQDALEIGDIIIATTASTISRAIRLMTSSRVSHSMLYIGGGQVVEAVGEGVRLTTLQNALSEASLAVALRYPDLTEQQALQIRDYVGMQIGKPYNYMGIVRQAQFRIDRPSCIFVNPLIGRRRCEDWMGRIYLGSGDNDSFFCSQLILEAYAQAGVPLTDRPGTWSSPEDFVELQLTNRLGYVGHLVALPVSSQAVSVPAQRTAIQAGYGRRNGSAYGHDGAVMVAQMPTALADAPDICFNYSVPGTVPALQQPSNMTCWATAAAMIMSWKQNQSLTLEAAVSRLGAPYAQRLRNNDGLPWQQHLAFAQAAGLTAEPLMNYAVQGIQDLLQGHGPLIAIAATPSGMWATHAVIITGVYGCGGMDDTYLQINDPATGTAYPIRYDIFMRRYEAAADRPGLGVQMMHY